MEVLKKGSYDQSKVQGSEEQTKQWGWGEVRDTQSNRRHKLFGVSKFMGTEDSDAVTRYNNKVYFFKVKGTVFGLPIILCLYHWKQGA